MPSPRRRGVQGPGESWPGPRPLGRLKKRRALALCGRIRASGGDLAGKAGATRGGAGDASSPSREPSVFVTRGRGVAGLSAARRAGRWRHARHAVLT